MLLTKETVDFFEKWLEVVQGEKPEGWKHGNVDKVAASSIKEVLRKSYLVDDPNGEFDPENNNSIFVIARVDNNLIVDILSSTVEGQPSFFPTEDKAVEFMNRDYDDNLNEDNWVVIPFVRGFISTN